ncbi:MAG: hypothetical protein QOG49_1925 [Frankiaceae bacterium]|nr:hypothetical protein [Frankiaceae bacterium]
MERAPDDAAPPDWDSICLTNLLAATLDHAYFKDLQSRFVRVSTGVVQAAGRPREELRGLPVGSESDLIGRTDFDLFTEQQARAAYDAEQSIIASGTPILGLVERETWPDGPSTYVMTNKMPLRAADGTIVGTFGFSRDITEDVLVRRQLAAVLAASPDAISRFDTELRYVFVNPAAQALLGGPEAQILGKTNAQLAHSTKFLGIWVAALEAVIDSGEPVQLEHISDRGPRPQYFDSRLVPEFDDDDVVTGILVFTRDITPRKRAELALAEQAVRDPLTGLANRVLLVDRLEQSLARLERSPGSLALLFMDLDKFKVVNDTLGHGFGDAVLVEVARRLNRCARRSDTVARFGGDEFVMLCDRVARPRDARAIADRIAAELADPFTHDGHTVQLSASIGIATTSDPRALPGAVIHDADTAMYLVKDAASLLRAAT